MGNLYGTRPGWIFAALAGEGRCLPRNATERVIRLTEGLADRRPPLGRLAIDALNSGRPGASLSIGWVWPSGMHATCLIVPGNGTGPRLDAGHVTSDDLDVYLPGARGSEIDLTISASLTAPLIYSHEYIRNWLHENEGRVIAPDGTDPDDPDPRDPVTGACVWVEHGDPTLPKRLRWTKGGRDE